MNKEPPHCQTCYCCQANLQQMAKPWLDRIAGPLMRSAILRDGYPTASERKEGER